MPKPPLQLNPASTVLVTVECQHGVVGGEGALPELAAQVGATMRSIGALAAAFRAAGGLVVHLTYVPAIGNRSSNRNAILLAGVLGKMDGWTADSPETQVVDEIGVGPDDVVLPRHSGLSPTHNTELFPMLRNAGYDSIVFAGVSLNIAMPVVATEAVDEGFRVIIPRDGVTGTPAEHAESMLRHTMSFIARIATCEEIVAALAT
ncbi:MAG TPA: cysteine hydrolase family protein [Mycobacteriales bacterium]|jgi:nicotinamidase-related amidase|nr:cysteine hydrolase family protein [Mycobacteriales bacterium]